MQDTPQLHSSIVAMVSLASGIAAKHPDMGQCQLERLRQAGVPQPQIDAVIEIARHIRDEAAQKFDAAFDTATAVASADKSGVEKGESACCTLTASGQSCC